MIKKTKIQWQNVFNKAIAEMFLKQSVAFDIDKTLLDDFFGIL
jgi:hypothetical protein